MAKDAKHQLLEFLDARVFQPALSVDPLGIASAEDRKLLRASRPECTNLEFAISPTIRTVAP
jgi:hypothetical protein